MLLRAAQFQILLIVILIVILQIVILLMIRDVALHVSHDLQIIPTTVFMPTLVDNAGPHLQMEFAILPATEYTAHSYPDATMDTMMVLNTPSSYASESDGSSSSTSDETARPKRKACQDSEAADWSSSSALLPTTSKCRRIDDEEIREGTFGAYTSANASATVMPAPHFNPKPVDISAAYHEETEKDERQDSTLDGESHCSPPFGVMVNECINSPSTRAMLIEAAVHSVLILRQARAMLIEVVARRSQCLTMSRSQVPILTSAHRVTTVQHVILIGCHLLQLPVSLPRAYIE
ncbi:hypothetical protein BDR05DRAFT_1011507 [Suillus weaverae]|nr:hypothetical protein BDR05DRAFT_1011507 [Suillus weaverae]